MKYTLSKILLSFFIATNFTLALQAQENVQSTATQQVEVEPFHYSDAQLAQMLAPIALYPDSLLTHILIASTYPLEVVEAQRWADKQSGIEQNERSRLLESKSWDPSVKALVPFENVLNRLSLDLTWTSTLGDVFLQDEERLLAVIQQLRQEAKNSGTLANVDNMDVSYEDDNIIITPSEPEVIYVPVYDSRNVYGAWRWYGYPPVYWSYPTPYYRSFYWAPPVYISFNYYFSAFHWHNRHIVTINHRNSRYYRPRNKIVSGGYAKRWHHKPSHRKGVVYANKGLHRKYYGASGPKYIPRVKNKNKSKNYQKHNRRLLGTNTANVKTKYSSNKKGQRFNTAGQINNRTMMKGKTKNDKKEGQRLAGKSPKQKGSSKLTRDDKLNKTRKNYQNVAINNYKREPERNKNHKNAVYKKAEPKKLERRKNEYKQVKANKPARHTPTRKAVNRKDRANHKPNKRS